MRGKGYVKATRASRRGITPAYAGKSEKESLTVERLRDHPRVCGEKLYDIPFSANQAGSPPRMRGKVSSSCTLVSCKGITPAYAGKRTRKQGQSGYAWDHPRVCGEKTKKIP